MKSLTENSVYYDGQCPVCSREINGMKAQGCGLVFEDIHQLDNVSENERSELLKQLHVVTDQGELLVGFAANLYLWRFGNLGWLAAILSFPVVRPVAKFAYELWAKKRYEKMYGKA